MNKGRRNMHIWKDGGSSGGRRMEDTEREREKIKWRGTLFFFCLFMTVFFIFFQLCAVIAKRKPRIRFVNKFLFQLEQIKIETVIFLSSLQLFLMLFNTFTQQTFIFTLFTSMLNRSERMNEVICSLNSSFFFVFCTYNRTLKKKPLRGEKKRAHTQKDVKTIQ